MKFTQIAALLASTTTAAQLNQKALAQTKFVIDETGCANEDVGKDLATIADILGNAVTDWSGSGETSKADVFTYLNRLDDRAIAADIAASSYHDSLSAQTDAAKVALDLSITNAKDSLRGSDTSIDLTGLLEHQNNMMNALLDVLQESIERSRYPSGQVKNIVDAVGAGYISGEAAADYSGHEVDADVIFA